MTFSFALLHIFDAGHCAFRPDFLFYKKTVETFFSDFPFICEFRPNPLLYVKNGRDFFLRFSVHLRISTESSPLRKNRSRLFDRFCPFLGKLGEFFIKKAVFSWISPVYAQKSRPFFQISRKSVENANYRGISVENAKTQNVFMHKIGQKCQARACSNKFSSSLNRVGGDFDKSPTSHTTVRTVPYTAVQST